MQSGPVRRLRDLIHRGVVTLRVIIVLLALAEIIRTVLEAAQGRVLKPELREGVEALRHRLQARTEERTVPMTEEDRMREEKEIITL